MQNRWLLVLICSNTALVWSFQPFRATPRISVCSSLNCGCVCGKSRCTRYFDFTFPVFGSISPFLSCSGVVIEARFRSTSFRMICLTIGGTSVMGSSRLHFSDSSALAPAVTGSLVCTLAVFDFRWGVRFLPAAAVRLSNEPCMLHGPLRVVAHRAFAPAAVHFHLARLRRGLWRLLDTHRYVLPGATLGAALGWVTAFGGVRPTHRTETMSPSLVSGTVMASALEMASLHAASSLNRYESTYVISSVFGA